MITRWWLPLGTTPERIRAEHLHGALTTLLDANQSAHEANDKPYAISPPTMRGGVLGVQIGTFNTETGAQLEESVGAGTDIRLGAAYVATGPLVAMSSTNWPALLEPSGRQAWVLEFRSPATVRSGSKSSPLYELGSVLSSLVKRWERWSALPVPLAREQFRSAMVTDLELRSVAPDWLHGSKSYTVSGALGWMRVEAKDAESATCVEPLLKWAEYCGVGSYTARGLGVVELVDTRQPGRVLRQSRSGGRDAGGHRGVPG